MPHVIWEGPFWWPFPVVLSVDDLDISFPQGAVLGFIASIQKHIEETYIKDSYLGIFNVVRKAKQVPDPDW